MIKMIAIDLDGTLLDDNKQFNKVQFNELVLNLKKYDIKVVIATGNQFIKTIQYFEEIAESLIYITDNGSTMHFGTQLYYSQTLSSLEYQQFMNKISLDIQKQIIVSTNNGAAMLKNPSADLLFTIQNHYPIIEELDHLSNINVDPIKLTVKLNDSDQEALQPIYSALPNNWKVTQSGFGYYDIIPAGVSKLTGIQELQRQFGIQTDEIMAFGDSNNDFELLEYVPNSFAMGNANKDVKQVAKYIIGTNNENAVIETLEKVFELVRLP